MCSEIMPGTWLGAERGTGVNYPKVKHPDWLQHCNIETTIRLSKARRIPDSIEGFMLVTACNHVLRCVYGTNLRAAWALLLAAIWTKLTHPWRYADYLIHRKQWEAEELADEMKDIEEDTRLKGER